LTPEAFAVLDESMSLGRSALLAAVCFSSACTVSGRSTGDAGSEAEAGVDGSQQGGADASVLDLGLPPPANCQGMSPTYYQDVRPILVPHCDGCHGAPPRRGATLVFDTYADVTAPTPYGVPVNVLIVARLYDMQRPQPPPPALGLNDAQKTLIHCWSQNGAPEGIAPDAGPPDASADAGADASPDAQEINPIDPLPTAVMIGSGYQFLGGVRWNAATQTLLFSDVNGDTIHQFQLPSTIDMGNNMPFRPPPAQNPNGMNFDTSGLLLVCEHNARVVTRTLASGMIVPVATDYMGLPFNSPNDVMVRSDGQIYFTDPPYGLFSRDAGVNFNGVFRVDTDGGVHAEYRGATGGPPNESRPNGLAFSPDERTMYVSDTVMNVVRAYDVATDGSLSNQRTFIAQIEVPDGLVTDIHGNLFVSNGGTMRGVNVFSPTGHPWGRITVPTMEFVGNVGFGGPNRDILYIITQTLVFGAQTTTRGNN
jgi:gluconolactonase